MKLIKCYYCGDYFDEEEAIGWDICATCALNEEREYEWMIDEQEDSALMSVDMDELAERGISVKLTKYEEDDESW